MPASNYHLFFSILPPLIILKMEEKEFINFIIKLKKKIVENMFFTRDTFKALDKTIDECVEEVLIKWVKQNEKPTLKIKEKNETR